MDKVVGELLAPFIRNITSGSLTATAFFWGLGVFLFHRFHPQAFPGCPAGGVELCGLLTKKDGFPWAVAGVLGLLLVLITTQGVSARAADVTQFLSGTRWSKRRLLVYFQHHYRERLINRGYGSRNPAPGADRIRQVNLRCRLRADRYPQGVGISRKPLKDPPRLVDVRLEPTFLGNVFAATNQYILAMHGLRLHSCWKLLLVVLPDAEKENLRASSSMVLSRVQIVIWAVMNCIWVVWIPGVQWEIGWVCGWLAVAYFAYRGLCTAAGGYCEELRMIVVAHRFLLYEKVNFPLPKSTRDEMRAGISLSGYLDRNGPPSNINFVNPIVSSGS